MTRSLLAMTLAVIMGVAVPAGHADQDARLVRGAQDDPVSNRAPDDPDASTAARAVFRGALDAMGGLEQGRRLKTLTVRARVVHRDNANATDTYEQQDDFQFPDASRTEIREPGQPNTVRQIMLNTPDGWWTAEGTDPPEWHAPPGQPYDPFMLRALLERVTDQSPLPAVVDENGPDTVIQETSDGTATAIQFHFARDTRLLLRRSAVATGSQQEDVEVFYDDYRHVEGFTVPFVIKTQHVGSSGVYTEEVTVQSVTFNPTIPGALFDPSSLTPSKPR